MKEPIAHSIRRPLAFTGAYTLREKEKKNVISVPFRFIENLITHRIQNSHFYTYYNSFEIRHEIKTRIKIFILLFHW